MCPLAKRTFAERVAPTAACMAKRDTPIPGGPAMVRHLTRGQPTEEHVIQPAQASGMGYPLG